MKLPTKEYKELQYLFIAMDNIFDRLGMDLEQAKIYTDAGLAAQRLRPKGVTYTEKQFEYRLRKAKAAEKIDDDPVAKAAGELFGGGFDDLAINTGGDRLAKLKMFFEDVPEKAKRIVKRRK
jgi:hypothetical protein